MCLIPDGGRIFEVISRYDDLLTMRCRQNYEPGDTLALIVPFLVLHQIKESDILRLARQADLTPGSRNLVSTLLSQEWHVFCITTTYQQYAFHIMQQLDIPLSHVSATHFPLDQFGNSLKLEDANAISKVELDILSMADRQDDEFILRRLDDFFWNHLPRTGLWELMKSVKPVGGKRKFNSLYSFSHQHDVGIGNWVVVGDSITDFQMLRGVRDAGGLAVAFNGNQYALPYGTISLISTHISDILQVLYVWENGNLKDVENFVREYPIDGSERNQFDWLIDKKDIGGIISKSREMRRMVREEAGELG